MEKWKNKILNKKEEFLKQDLKGKFFILLKLLLRIIGLAIIGLVLYVISLLIYWQIPNKDYSYYIKENLMNNLISNIKNEWQGKKYMVFEEDQLKSLLKKSGCEIDNFKFKKIDLRKRKNDFIVFRDRMDRELNFNCKNGIRGSFRQIEHTEDQTNQIDIDLYKGATDCRFHFKGINNDKDDLFCWTDTKGIHWSH